MMRQVVLFHIRQVPLGHPHVVRKVVYHVVQHVCSVVGRRSSIVNHTSESSKNNRYTVSLKPREKTSYVGDLSRLTERKGSGDHPVRHGFREDDVCELSERGFQDEKQGRGHDQSESAVSADNQLSATRNRQEERKTGNQRVMIRRNSLVHRQIMMNPM